MEKTLITEEWCIYALYPSECLVSPGSAHPPRATTVKSSPATTEASSESTTPASRCSDSSCCEGEQNTSNRKFQQQFLCAKQTKQRLHIHIRGGPTRVHESLQVQCIAPWTLSRDPELVVIRARMSDLLCVYEYCKWKTQLWWLA